MNTEVLNQVSEIIKTWNVNLNSETSVELASQVKDVMYIYFLKDFVIDVLGIIGFVVAVYFISKAVRSYYQDK